MSMGLPLHLMLLTPILLLMAFLPRDFLHPLIVIMGQAHVFMGYYYKFGSAQGMKNYKTRILMLLALSVPVYVLAYSYTAPIIFCVAVLFVIHHLFDEMELFGANQTTANLLSIAPLFSIMTVYLCDIEFDTGLYPPLKEMFLLVSAGAVAYTLLRNNNSFALYMTGLATALALFFYLSKLDDIHIIFAVAISHYVNWYVHIGRKLYMRDKKKFSGYMRDVAVFNGAIVGLFFAAQHFAFLSFANIVLFSVPAFYASTLLHCIAMYRPGDFISLRTALRAQ